VDWSLLVCARTGHLTYAPDEAGVREQLILRGSSGDAWRCLRCGTFVPGEPTTSGPAAQAPAVRRGRELRSMLILRVFAVDRYLRAVAAGALAVLVWRLGYSRPSIEQAFDREVPILRELFQQFGYNIERSRLVGLIHEALALSPTTIKVLTIVLAGYAVIEVFEGTGLWLARRWGEYFAMVATCLGVPYEIYDLVSRVTVTRVVLFVINLVLIFYLVVTKRLFGARGGHRAYQARLRSESIMQAAVDAAPAQPAEPDQTAPPFHPAADRHPAGDHAAAAGHHPAADHAAAAGHHPAADHAAAAGHHPAADHEGAAEPDAATESATADHDAKDQTAAAEERGILRALATERIPANLTVRAWTCPVAAAPVHE
jgi:uncharacterized membrane protein (DUF2068 family)